MKTFLWNSCVRYGVAGAAGKLARVMAAVVFTAGLVLSVAAPAARAQTVHITALGDSLTAGYGLPQGDGLVPQLQAWIDSHGLDAVVTNAGVSGDTTSGALTRLDWTLQDHPDAMIVELGGNDMLRGIDPALTWANLAAILDRLDADHIPSLLVGVPAPTNYGADYQTQFTAIFPDLARQYDTLLMANLLAPISEASATGTPAADMMQADMIHPNAAGVSRIVEVLGPKIEELITRARAQHQQQLAQPTY